ncbi:Cytoplasmic FMR1-interacting protein 2, partial [Nowakowskiella sp. JEL0078]
IKHTLLAYIKVIQKGTPQSLILPLFEYGTTGCFEYFSAHFRPLLNYSPLKSEVFQAFREMGNAILLVRCMDETLIYPFQKLQASQFSLLPSFLVHIQKTLKSVVESDELGELSDFYKIWTSLLFTFCIQSKNEAIRNKDIFGEGLNWAGCTIISLLKQRHIFSAFDFNSHILAVQKSEKPKMMTLDSDVTIFLEDASFIQLVNEEVFDILNNIQKI